MKSVNFQLQLGSRFVVEAITLGILLFFASSHAKAEITTAAITQNILTLVQGNLEPVETHNGVPVVAFNGCQLIYKEMLNNQEYDWQASMRDIQAVNGSDGGHVGVRLITKDGQSRILKAWRFFPTGGGKREMTNQIMLGVQDPSTILDLKDAFNALSKLCVDTPSSSPRAIAPMPPSTVSPGSITCYTQFGTCMLPQLAAVGTPCICFSPAGQIPGVLR